MWASKSLTDAQRLKRAADLTIDAAETAAGHPLPSLRNKKFPPRLRNATKARKTKRERQLEKQESNNVFSTFTLNKDPDCSQYMPYDDVSYPKLSTKKPSEQSFAELDSMWMVGFLHHNKKTKDEEVARELGESRDDNTTTFK